MKKKNNQTASTKNKFFLMDTVKGHWYYIENADFPNGIELPSVTNILDLFPNPQLDFWKENTSPEEIKLKQDEGKQQGSKVHHCCYLLSVGEEINPNIGLTKEQVRKLPLQTDEDKLKDDALLDYLLEPLTTREIRGIEGFANFWEEFKPITIARELEVYHKSFGYAGTLDWVGYLWNKKLKKYELWIIDYKISNSHSLCYESQIVCYERALKSMFKKRFKARLGILYLGKTTKKRFQLKEVSDRTTAWDRFMMTKKFWHSLYPEAKPKIKELVDNVKVDVSHKKKGKLIKLIK